MHCLDDIESDMSVFHRIDDITALDGPRFFRLVWRLPAYEGAMRARLQAERDEQPRQSASGVPLGPPPGSGSAEWNPGTKATLMADASLKGIFSFG